MTMPIEVREDETVMTLVDAMLLKEIMEGFRSFEELKAAVSKYHKSYNLDCRYPFEFDDLPGGSVRDWFIAVVNVFGDEGVRKFKGSGVPSKLERKYLVSKVQEELGKVERTVNGYIQSLINSEELVEEYGMVLFPKHKLKVKK